MSGALTIHRSNLGLDDLVIGDDDSTGFTLAPGLSLGVIQWRKNNSSNPNAPGRVMTDYTRDVMTVAGGVNCFGDDPVELQDRIGELVTALTQVDPDAGFQSFVMVYKHTAAAVEATYRWRCTEPADLTPGNAPDGTLDDAQMASLIQTVGFSIVRHPIPIDGPI